VKRHNELRHAWFLRKSMCVDAVDLLAEGMGKKTKQMIVSPRQQSLFLPR
jgi:hypothetical protein